MTLQEIAATETFLEVESIVTATARSFARTHGAEEEEVLSEASTLYWKAYTHFGKNGYSNSRLPFDAFVKQVIWRGLLDEARKRSRRHESTPIITTAMGNGAGEVDVVEREPDWIEGFMRDLSSDGQEVVRRILAMPSHYGARQARNSLHRRLYFDLDWSDDRIEAAMDEVRESLWCPRK